MKPLLYTSPTHPSRTPTIIVRVFKEYFLRVVLKMK